MTGLTTLSTAPTNGVSPASEATVTPASATSSEGRSPKRRFFNQDSFESSDSSINRHWVVDGGPSHAPRACEKCRLSKRRCDKKLPHCDRCIRLNAKCHYLQDAMSANSTSNGAQILIYQQPTSGLMDEVLVSNDPLAGVSPSQILAHAGLCEEGEGDWRKSAHDYFTYIHPWFGAIHRIFFEHQVAGFQQSLEAMPSPVHSRSSVCSGDQFDSTQRMGDFHSKEFAMLVVAMCLATRAHSKAAGAGMFGNPYRSIKRMLSLLLFDCAGPGDFHPSIELVQAGALIALYEFGHGEALTAYRTLSQTAATACAMGVLPGVKDQAQDPGGGGSNPPRRMSGLSPEFVASLERQQKNNLWWGLFILDQFIHTDEGAQPMPFILETPSPQTLLPESPPVSIQSTPRGSFDMKSISPPLASKLFPVSTMVGSVDLATYQLSAKTASLLHRALRWDRDREKSAGSIRVGMFEDLDREIRLTTGQLLRQDFSWNLTLDSFTMCVSALFTLYIPYLKILETLSPEAIQADDELRTALAALRFTCKMSTDISCKINGELDPTQPEVMALLAAPAGITCYFVIISLASFARVFPQEQAQCYKSISAKFSSLEFFGLKWGLAIKMIEQLNLRYGIRPADFNIEGT